MSTVKSKKLQVGTDASASNNFTIYQPAVPDGTLRVGVGNADNPTEVGRFTSAGYKPQQPVIFRASMAATQNISAATWTKIQLDIIDFDTNTNFDNTTNYRFTPTVAGYYQVNGTMLASCSGNMNFAFIAIYKNGVKYVGGYIGLPSLTNTALGVTKSDVYYMNGTTDYLELYGWVNGGGTIRILANSSENYPSFSAHLISQA